MHEKEAIPIGAASIRFQPVYHTTFTVKRYRLHSLITFKINEGCANDSLTHPHRKIVIVISSE